MKPVRSSALAAAGATLVYLMWAEDTPTALGTGGYMIWAPLVFGVAWLVLWAVFAAVSIFRR